MTRPGTGLIVLGVLMLLGSAAAVTRATPFMNVFNFTLATVVVLWGITRRVTAVDRI